MVRIRALVIVFVAGLATVGVPSHVAGAESVPRAREARAPVAAALAPGHSVEQLVRNPWTTNLIGVSFVGGTDPESVEVAVKARASGVWTDWVTLRIEPDEGADRWEERRASGRIFTEPAFVGHADAVRVRVSSARDAIADVRAHTYNTLGEPARGIGGVLRAIGRALRGTAATPAEAHPAKPSIISRRGWGADESLRSDGPGLASKVSVAFVHHTVNSNSYSKSESAGLVRGIYRYHTRGRGYSDIGYNFLVDRYGQIFEGRWGGVDKAVIGAHTMGFNTYTTGVALIGTFTTATPPSAMLGSLKRLLAWKMDNHHIPAIGRVTLTSGGNDKYAKGTRVRFNRISGHRDGTSTSCPGTQTYKKLPWLREAVNAYGRPKIYFPRASSTTLRPDGNGINESVTIAARFSQTVRWAVRYIDSSGTIRRKLTGTASSMSSTWNGTASGALVPTGRYTWRVDARSASGHLATPAFGTVYVVSTHPSGTLLRDASGIYTIEGGAAVSVSSPVRASTFGALPTTATGPSERARYAAGGWLGLRRGTLLEGPDGTRYIFSGGALRPFVRSETDPEADTFAALGYDPVDLIAMTQSAIDKIGVGTPVTDVTRHPEGTVVKDAVTGQKWYMGAATRRPMTTLSRASRYRVTEVVTALEGDLLVPLDERPFPVRTGALVKAPDGGAPWLIEAGRKRQFRDWGLFSRMGFTTAMLLGTSSADLGAVPTGAKYG